MSHWIDITLGALLLPLGAGCALVAFAWQRGENLGSLQSAEPEVGDLAMILAMGIATLVVVAGVRLLAVGLGA